MEVLLTERLVCPRCGPAFGLVLLADRVEGRRALEGSLGCPNCRDRFPVVEGFADLRAPPRDPLPAAGLASGDREGAMRVAALLGIASGPARVLLAGSLVGLAQGIADIVAELEVIALFDGMATGPERAGVTRMAAGPVLPFRTGSLQGLATSGDVVRRLLPEAARVTAPGGRLVVMTPPPGVEVEVDQAGLETKGVQAEALVAEKRGPKTAVSGVRLPVVRGS
jgi:uncharacterized protein YbaR (Trm112 family)